MRFLNPSEDCFGSAIGVAFHLCANIAQLVLLYAGTAQEDLTVQQLFGCLYCTGVHSNHIVYEHVQIRAGDHKPPHTEILSNLDQKVVHCCLLLDLRGTLCLYFMGFLCHFV